MINRSSIIQIRFRFLRKLLKRMSATKDNNVRTHKRTAFATPVFVSAPGSHGEINRTSKRAEAIFNGVSRNFITFSSCSCLKNCHLFRFLGKQIQHNVYFSKLCSLLFPLWRRSFLKILFSSDQFLVILSSHGKHP